MPIRERNNFNVIKILDKFLTKIFLGIGLIGVNMVIGDFMDEHRKPEDMDATKLSRALVTATCYACGFYVIKNMLTLNLMLIKYKKMLQRHNNMLVANNNVHNLNNFINLAKELEHINQKRTKQQNTGPLSLS